MVAGLESVSEGEISINDKRVNELEPMDRDIAMVFQNYALYPHMSVRENMGYGLKIAKLPKTEINAKVEAAAKLLQLEDYLDRRPRDLSGGQRQRVAMGRAIVREPAVFLFDEPLSNLDAKLRVQMRLEIRELQNRLGITSLYVTHDQVEAMTMADKIVVLRAGFIEQVGSPLELYHRPTNIFVAGFIGSPKMNLIAGAEAKKHDATTIGIRPEHLTVSATEGAWKGRVGVSEHLGSDTFFYVHDTGLTDGITVRVSGEVALRSGDTVYLTPDADKIHRFDDKGLRIE